MPQAGPSSNMPPFTVQDKLNCEQALRDLQNAALVLPKCAACGINIDDIQQEIQTRIKLLNGIQEQFMKDIR